MSHCASFLCLNGLSRASFAHAGHLTAGDGTLEPAEIVAVPRTAYRVFFENLQMFGATKHWNDGKFVHSEQQGVGTYGNSFPANDETQRLAEICSQQATGYWNDWKFVASEQQGVGTDRNSLPVSDERLEPAEICSQHAMEYWNWWKTSASFYEVKLGKQGFALRSRKNSQ